MEVVSAASVRIGSTRRQGLELCVQKALLSQLKDALRVPSHTHTLTMQNLLSQFLTNPYQQLLL